MSLIGLLPPPPPRVDQLAKQYLALKEKAEEAAQAAVDALKPVQAMAEELRELVRQHGSVHSEKSKLLHGIDYEVMATSGQSAVIDAGAVETFRVALVKKKQARLLRRMFEKTVRWSLLAGSAAIVKGETLSAPLMALYAKCQVVKDKTPTLTVRLKSG